MTCCVVSFDYEYVLLVTQIEQLPEVLPTVDPQLGALVHSELERHGVDVLSATAVESIARSAEPERGRLRVEARNLEGAVIRHADVVLVVVGVRPDVELAASSGVALGDKGAIAVDRSMRTNLPNVFAAGDCVVTHHRLLGSTYLPLGTTAHKQGRVAGENAIGGAVEFAGSLGTQVVKVFDLVAARTGLRDHEAETVGFAPLTIHAEADDHKAYYPGSHRISMRYTGDKQTGRLLGAQLVGHRNAEIAKRIDIAAVALFHEMTVDTMSELDLSYTPPLGSPWDSDADGRPNMGSSQSSRSIRDPGTDTPSGNGIVRSETYGSAAVTSQFDRCLPQIGLRSRASTTINRVPVFAK